MIKSGFILLALVAMALPSCSPIQTMTTDSRVVVNRDGIPALPQHYSMLDMGRAISGGDVDVYDPWLTVFMVTPPGHLQDPLDMFPPHGGLYVSDKHVKVYSLSSDGVEDDSFTNVLTALDGELLGGMGVAPIPLVTEEALLP